MDAIQELLASQKSLEAAVSQRMDKFEMDFRAASTPETTQSGNTSQLYNEFKHFQEQILQVLSGIRAQISAILRSLDSLEMHQRRKYLLLSGVAENNETLSNTVVSLLSNQLSLPDLTASSLHSCYRLGSSMVTERPRPIVLRFSNYDLRSSVWGLKTKLKGTPYVITEFLTKYRQSLFTQARKHFGIRTVWSMEGNIFIKTENGERHKVLSQEDLDSLIARFPREVKEPPSVISINVVPPQVAKPVSTRINKNTARRNNRPVKYGRSKTMGELAYPPHQDEDDVEAFQAIVSAVDEIFPTSWRSWRIHNYTFNEVFGDEVLAAN
ncbi:hypothetical protein ACJJTC_015662 [Scirpophaga incertulas]